MSDSCLSKDCWLLSTYSINSLSCFIVTTCNPLSSYILISPPNVIAPKVIAVVGVVTSTLGGIVLTYFYYRNYSSNCVTEPYSRYYGRLVIGGYIDS